jgi:hypothetical protein
MAKNTGMIHETGDRWKLDILIPSRDRLLVGPQVPRTSRMRVATRSIVLHAKLSPALAFCMPIHSGIETTLDGQKRLRLMYCNDQPLPGDRLL